MRDSSVLVAWQAELRRLRVREPDQRLALLAVVAEVA